MADLRTTYMGLELAHPIIAGASPLTADMRSIKRLEEAGASAIVIRSLFEEQIQLERIQLDEDLTEYNGLSPEIVTAFPRLKHAGPEEHLMWVRKAKESVGIPVIASLNAVSHDTWVEYASLLQQTGADAVELNFYATPSDASLASGALEDEQIAILHDIRQTVSIPISAKLSPFYTNPLHIISRMDAEGVNGFVLFNRFFQPDIDVAQEQPAYPLNLSHGGEYGMSLRFTGLLAGAISGDICASTGIFSGEDVAKLILAGAACVQVVSALLRNRVSHLQTMVAGLQAWMDAKGYAALGDFRAKLSRERSSDPWAYTRAQYVRTLMKPDPLNRGGRGRRI
ncbi:MAG: dihydroorotate dehydrogenase-like protein [Anaerolineales bacterium]|nr:dihydroorotate dehydrogenase-like protein [Anaerolineales bacterium]